MNVQYLICTVYSNTQLQMSSIKFPDTFRIQLYASSREATRDNVTNKLCFDGRSEFPSGNTCFRRSTVEYGSCPFAQATNCSDSIHCCPNGYICWHDDCTKDKVKICNLNERLMKLTLEPTNHSICINFEYFEHFI